MPEFIVGDVVVHDASGTKGVIVELLEGDMAVITTDFGKSCRCSLDAFHVLGDEQ